ncbi:MAG: kinase/pyrophosphorylase [Coriobacteriales bacterium]|jgi:regulator of PEP synthase PpsR (kinase-PPPase family)|nr:kinase/pyrophosphorylase [Coriobacteriales bacterium]
METQTTTRPVIYIISDSLGDSAATMAVAAASQFSEGSCVIRRLPKATSLEQMATFIEAHLEEAGGQEADEMVLFHTIADVALRAELEDYLRGKPIAAADLIGPAIDTIAEATGRKPKGQPGLIRRTDQEYFDRVGALEFAVDHDDGRNAEQLAKADIVLIGVSRSSKTPLAIYLASHGYRVANVPLAAGTEPPHQLFEIDPRRIFGLTSSAGLLSEIRYRRLGEAREVASAYAEPASVQTDLDEARQLMRRLGCIVVRTDNRAIEETAQEILRYYDLTYPSHERPI